MLAFYVMKRKANKNCFTLEFNALFHIRNQTMNSLILLRTLLLTYS